MTTNVDNINIKSAVVRGMVADYVLAAEVGRQGVLYFTGAPAGDQIAHLRTTPRHKFEATWRDYWCQAKMDANDPRGALALVAARLQNAVRTALAECAQDAAPHRVLLMAVGVRRGAVSRADRAVVGFPAGQVPPPDEVLVGLLQRTPPEWLETNAAGGEARLSLFGELTLMVQVGDAAGRVLVEREFCVLRPDAAGALIQRANLSVLQEQS